MVKPKLKVISANADYRYDPARVFYHLCGDKSSTLLFESAEINNKQGIKSFLITDAALKLTAMHSSVEIKALTDNGKALLHTVKDYIASGVEVLESTDSLLVLEYPVAVLDIDEDSRLKSSSVFDGIRSVINAVNSYEGSAQCPVFIGGLFGYDLVAGFEDLPKLPTEQKCPDYCLYVAETLVEINHKEKSCDIKSHLFYSGFDEEQRLVERVQELKKGISGELADAPEVKVPHMELTCNMSDKGYGDVVESLKTYIKKGDIFQTVPSRRFKLPCLSAFSAYRVLKKNNPSPYMFYMHDEDFEIFGASPESALKYNKSTNKIEIYPIAGTRPRGLKADGTVDYDLDCRIELEMRTDTKELSEHLMLVDLARNDLARICKAGTRYVTNLLGVDKYSYVMHLVSQVTGELRTDLDALHAYRATMNMGTLTGAPKVRAMQLISELENTRRGSYGGAMGYINTNGDLDTCIVIRSAYVEDGVASVQSGGGIVLDSDPVVEAEETKNKAKAVLRAIMQAHGVKEVYNG